MILDVPTECPRCGKPTKLFDEMKIGVVVVARVCSLCSERLCKPISDEKQVEGPLGSRRPAKERLLLDLLLVEFRQRVQGVQHAVDRHCETCSGQGWRALAGGKRVSVRRERCRDCVGTGIDLRALLELWEIQEKPKPLRREPLEGFSPGRSIRKGREP